MVTCQRGFWNIWNTDKPGIRVLSCHTAVPIIIYGYPCIPLYPYSDRRTYRYRRISMSGGIIAFPIRVCHGLDSNILDKLLTWWYRNKKKSVIMVFTRVREATSFYCRTSGIVSSMCEKEFFLSSQRFFHIPKGGRESRPASVFFFLPIWHKTTIHDYSCLCAGRACLSWFERILTCVKNLSTCGDRLYERNCYNKSYKWLDG